MKKNNQKLIIIGLLMIMSFIMLYVGHFLFFTEKGESAAVTAPASGTEAVTSVLNANKESPVKYENISKKINGCNQQIFKLEFDPKDPRIEFKPVLSYDNLFGFEKLSEICKRKESYAAINAGFYFEFGDPVGLVTIDGKAISLSTTNDPIFVFDHKGAYFSTAYSSLSFTVNNKKTTINKMNRTGLDGDIVLYTDYYGKTNRAGLKNTSIVIEQNTVSAIYENVTEVSIKRGSSVISFYGKSADIPENLGITEGAKLNISIWPSYRNQAYSCGSMLVKDGEAVAPKHDKWIGTLQNRDPRTAIGIKADGKVVMLVVDGRQPGYSVGFTADELAEYLLNIGVKDAAMLDGGASSQMFVDGRLVNKPSYRGIERPVGGAFVLRIKES